MKPLKDLGVYIASHAGKEDPLKLGAIVARKLGLRSRDVEFLLYEIYLATRFGVDETEVEEAEKTIRGTPWYDTVTEVLQEKDAATITVPPILKNTRGT